MRTYTRSCITFNSDLIPLLKMSFYDLTKDFVLSAKELFKYRGKRDNTLPSKGGQKDFEADESWLQTKALESFLQERTSVLAEPRVEKLKNLVKGNWDNERGLINVHKPGKFWANMGFMDKQHKWLYPEEALFLMESNTLEVCRGGVPLSIQEAYNVFLGSDVSIEEYQVFSHLRRLGFIVKRHENQPVITPYEKQINIDKYMGKKSRKDRPIKSKKNKNLEQNVQSNGINNSNHSSATTSKLSSNPDKTLVTGTKYAEKSKEDNIVFQSSKDVHSHENNLSESCSKGSSMEVEQCTPETDHAATGVDNNIGSSTVDSRESDDIKSKSKKRSLSPEVGSGQDSSKRSCLDDESVVSSHSQFNIDYVADIHPTFYDNSWSSCFVEKTKVQLQALHNTNDANLGAAESKDTSTDKLGNLTASETSNINVCEDTLPLPNIANTEMVVLKPPSPHLLPENVDIEKEPELLKFDVGKYHIMNPQKELKKQAQREEDRNRRLQGLEFSLSEWMQKQPKVPAGNWKEYKHKLSERVAEISKTTPVDHLWKGKVTPLLHPGQSWSYQSILDKLSIIKSADNETLLTDSDCVVDVKIAFDVHLPDSQFKKSMPGVPNHRVCVSKCLSDLPGLAEIQQVWSRFKDTVPLHWAVVDSGEIAFYVFDSSRTAKVFL